MYITLVIRCRPCRPHVVHVHVSVVVMYMELWLCDCISWYILLLWNPSSIHRYEKNVNMYTHLFAYCVHTILGNAWNAWNSTKRFTNEPGHLWQSTRPWGLISIVWIYFWSTVRADLLCRKKNLIHLIALLNNSNIRTCIHTLSIHVRTYIHSWLHHYSTKENLVNLQSATLMQYMLCVKTTSKAGN